MQFFYSSSHSYLDLKPSDLKVELARDIIIPSIYIKLYKNPLVLVINLGTRAMLDFFSKNNHNDLDFEYSTLNLLEILSY